MTSFDEIIDLALVTIQDYKLDMLYQKSQDDWRSFLSGYIVRAVPLFTNSKIDLDYDIETQKFVNDLGVAEKSILAELVNYVWLEREIRNISQINLTMTPSDAKRYSEAQNLKEKSEYCDRMREVWSQMLVDYELKRFDWGSLGNGVFI